MPFLHFYGKYPHSPSLYSGTNYSWIKKYVEDSELED